MPLDRPAPTPILLTIGEAADILGISISTAKKLAGRGALPGVLPKVGGQWRVNRDVLIEWLDKNAARDPEDRRV